MLAGVLIVAAVVASTLPASMIARALPPGVSAEDFSGTVWHGSAGRIVYAGLDVGALEWQLHPAALLRLAAAADLRWVKTSVVLNAHVEATRGGFVAHAVQGGGPIEDLQAFGVPAGWTGNLAVDASTLKGNFLDGDVQITAAVGEVRVENLASSQFTGGADIGGYRLRLADGAITPDADATAELADLGGPLEANAAIHYSVKERRVLLNGTVRERGKLPPALHEQLKNLAQLKPRDAQGRLPVDLEFTL